MVKYIDLYRLFSIKIDDLFMELENGIGFFTLQMKEHSGRGEFQVILKKFEEAIRKVDI